MLVAGNILDSRIWNDQVEAMSRLYRVLRFDLCGSGRSSGAAAPFRHATDMATLLRRLHADQASVMGIAEGTTIAVEFALEYPDKVEALVLVTPLIRGYIPQTISDES